MITQYKICDQVMWVIVQVRRPIKWEEGGRTRVEASTSAAARSRSVVCVGRHGVAYPLPRQPLLMLLGIGREGHGLRGDVRQEFGESELENQDAA